MRNGSRRSNLISQTPEFKKPATAAFYYKSNTAMYRSTNGTSWSLAYNMETTTTYTGASIMANGKIPFVTTANPFQAGVSTTMGRSWGNFISLAGVASGFGMNQLGGTIYQKANNVYFIYSGNATSNVPRFILRTTDNGATFTNIAPGTANYGASFLTQGTGTKLMASGTRTGGGDTTMLWFSSDNGSNWSGLTNPFAASSATAMIFGIAYSPTLDMWVALRGENTSPFIAYSTNDGTSWTTISPVAGMPSFGNRWKIVWSTIWSCFIARTTGGTNTDYWTSTDGTSWTQRSLPTAVNGAAISNIIEGNGVMILHSSDTNYTRTWVGGSTVGTLTEVILPAASTNGVGAISYYDP